MNIQFFSFSQFKLIRALTHLWREDRVRFNEFTRKWEELLLVRRGWSWKQWVDDYNRLPVRAQQFWLVMIFFSGTVRFDKKWVPVLDESRLSQYYLSTGTLLDIEESKVLIHDSDVEMLFSLLELGFTLETESHLMRWNELCLFLLSSDTFSQWHEKAIQLLSYDVEKFHYPTTPFLLFLDYLPSLKDEFSKVVFSRLLANISRLDNVRTFINLYIETSCELKRKSGSWELSCLPGISIFLDFCLQHLQGIQIGSWYSKGEVKCILAILDNETKSKFWQVSRQDWVSLDLEELSFVQRLEGSNSLFFLDNQMRFRRVSLYCEENSIPFPNNSHDMLKLFREIIILESI